MTVTLRGGSLRGHSGIVFCWGPDGPHLVFCLLLVQLFYSCAWAIVLMKGSLWGSFYEMRVCIQAPGELQSLGWGKPLNSHLNYFTSFIYPVISVLVFTTNWIVLPPLEYTPDDYSQSKDWGCIWGCAASSMCSSFTQLSTLPHSQGSLLVAVDSSLFPKEPWTLLLSLVYYKLETLPLFEGDSLNFNPNVPPPGSPS